MKRIAIFGPGTCRRDSQVYKSAMKVGELLAKAEALVVTGGYNGVMEAAPRGARKESGMSMAFTHSAKTSNEFISLEVPATSYLKSEQLLDGIPHVDHLDYMVRLGCLVGNSDGYIIYPGGIGTFLELVTVLFHASKFGGPKPIAIVYPPNRNRAYDRSLWEYEIGALLQRARFIHSDLICHTEKPQQAVKWVLK